MAWNPFTGGRITRRATAVVGGAALAAGVVLSIHSTPAPLYGDVDAHEKFDVVTVIARPPAAPPATVTETDKPHRLQTTRATPTVLAPRTVGAQKS